MATGTSNFLRDILLPEHCTDEYYYEYQHGHAPPRSVLPYLPQNWVIQVSLASVPHLATSTLKFPGGFCCRDHANIHAGFPCAGQSSHFIVQALPPVSSRSTGARRFRLFFHYWSQVRSILWKVSRSMSCSKTNQPRLFQCRMTPRTPSSSNFGMPSRSQRQVAQPKAPAEF